MFNISDYLKKFSRIEGDSLAQRDAIAGAMREACGAEIDFEVKKDIIYIKGSPVVRSIVYTKKGAILEAIKIRQPKLRISDIR
jgi:hypothetical protein